MPAALDWLATAAQCFRDDYRCLRQGLLTSVFALVVGLERIFHLDEMEDLGFARLCGGRRCPSRYAIGGWRRHLTWYEVDAFCRRTFPWHLVRNQHSLLSFDEHTIPRWTKKYRIGKGYVTTRNQYMRCEKLFTGYDLDSQRFVTVRATPGDVGLQDLAVPLIQQVFVGPGRPAPAFGSHAADLPLSPPLASLEATAQRPVRFGRGTRRVCRCRAQGNPPGRDRDGAQGGNARGSDPHHRLPRGSARPQGRSLAPVVHDDRGRSSRRVDDVPRPATSGTSFPGRRA